mmetsp:Transcript_9205/g.24844  ORF Transcript_9205/g.24844 Transcript_9205/m.24844 type:complete len:204 (-) Transcript_9205:283-894(-)|eukprot:CAMPEP_0198109892 /NCGR_PEP_ID=MMETSP1442-20131203/1930_1 /TAXON_ID= /ORGANISM="Craspedostauros australis, Strain CCMP3328" /LENGTH=203 /DNA_ID=CAMNT_0043765733 /DNA_START=305 /DNA_END=916 /DNA_ORIENTATION=+
MSNSNSNNNAKMKLIETNINHLDRLQSSTTVLEAASAEADYLSAPNPVSRSSSASSSTSRLDSSAWATSSERESGRQVGPIGSHDRNDPFAPKPINPLLSCRKRQHGDVQKDDSVPSPDKTDCNRDLFEDMRHKKTRRRQRRRARMAAVGVGGFVVGGVFLGPIGACAGCVSGAAITRAASKLSEKRKDRRLQKKIGRNTLLV